MIMGFFMLDEDGNPKRAKRIVIDCQKAIENGEKYIVEQSHKDEVNINNIVRKHGADLVAKVAALQKFEYDDVTTNDFQEMMNIMIKARDTFDKVPLDIRKRFGHDPAEFMDFVHNPDNAQALIDMGLAEPPEPPPAPVQVQVVNPDPQQTPDV